jgi:hypothetical protein
MKCEHTTREQEKALETLAHVMHDAYCPLCLAAQLTAERAHRHALWLRLTRLETATDDCSIAAKIDVTKANAARIAELQAALSDLLNHHDQTCDAVGCVPPYLDGSVVTARRLIQPAPTEEK